MRKSSRVIQNQLSVFSYQLSVISILLFTSFSLLMLYKTFFLAVIPVSIFFCYISNVSNRCSDFIFTQKVYNNNDCVTNKIKIY